VDDTVRLCQFIYRNLGILTQVTATLDTHMSIQIFHAIFLVDAAGAHPAPYSQVSAEDVRSGKWKFNPALAGPLDISPEYGQEMLLHYVTQLETSGKYALTIWPYHAMLGGVGHALVSSVEEALFFHSIARTAQVRFEVKGDHPFTENYSAIGPEVQTGPMGEALSQRNTKFVDTLQDMDALIVAGQAKSHCVAWTVADLLEDVRSLDPALAQKIYLLEDCSSPVVVPGADFTKAADKAYADFARAGVHLVKSTDPIETWKGFPK
jgi:nicotinamidase-related amidase